MCVCVMYICVREYVCACVCVRACHVCIRVCEVVCQRRIFCVLYARTVCIYIQYDGYVLSRACTYHCVSLLNPAAPPPALLRSV